MKVASTHSVNHKMGFKSDFDRGEVEYWYSPATYTRLKYIDILRISPKSRFIRLVDRHIPLHVDKETNEVTVDEGILNLLIS